MSANRVLPHFQPLGNLRDTSVFGYESLIRGPADSPLHYPDALFRAAREQDCEIELEIHCCRVAVRDFVRSQRHGKLLLNMSADAIVAAAVGQFGDLISATKSFGLLPSRVVIEITEHDRVSQLEQLREVLDRFRRKGVGLALDDFGDGRSSLRMWTDLRPDLVKIDKHFVDGIHADNEKFEVLRVFKYISETFGGALVAEGIASEPDLAVLRDMGISYGQGFFLGRPRREPAAELLPAAVATLRARKIAVFPEIKEAARSTLTARTLIIEAPAVSARTTNDELVQVFRESPNLHAVAVLGDAEPVGLVNRQEFMDRYVQPYHKELYGRRSCTLFMNPSPLVIEQDTPLLNLVDVLRGDDQRYLKYGFIIADEGAYVGLGTGERLVRAVSELRIEAARHANPLTALPGNIPISEHVDRLLAGEVSFVACYCDLRHFKPFNDCYGYWRGDEMIRLVAGLLVANCDSLRDFIGHVGGDDFVVLMQSADWEARLLYVISEFNERAALMYDEEAQARRGIESEDREGHPCFFPLSTLVIGAVLVQPHDFSRPEDVASAAAKAKRIAKHDAAGFRVIRARKAGSAAKPGLELVDELRNEDETQSVERLPDLSGASELRPQ